MRRHPSRVVRTVRGYSLGPGRLVHEVRLPEHTSLVELQRIFHEDPRDPMFECYPVDDSRKRLQLAGVIGENIFREGLDYFLEADSVEDDE